MVLGKEECSNKNVRNSFIIITSTEDKLKLVLKQLTEYADISKEWIKITTFIT